MNLSNNKKRRRGLILIELLIAMAVFAIGVTTVFALFIGATQGVIIGLEKSRGMLLSTEALEAASAIARKDPNYLTPGKYEVGVNHNNQWILIPKTGLMSHFLLANNAQDSSPNKHHGITQQINFLEDRKGQPQAAAVFNGKDSHIRTEYAHSLQIEGPLTLAAWTLDTSPDTGEIRTIAGRQNAYLLSKQGNEYRFTVFGEENTATLPAEHSAGGWQHIVAVYDPGGATFLRLYINGEEKEPRETDIPAIKKAPGKEFFVGAEENDQGDIINVWHGRISDVRVYKRALTSNEIAGLYNSYSAPYEKSLVISDTDELAGIWSFNEGEGCTAHDNSRNNNHGLIKNCSPEQPEQWAENRQGKSGRAFNFEEDNYIEIADSSSLRLEDKEEKTISISLWIKTPEDLPEEDMVIFHKRAAGFVDFSFALVYEYDENEETYGYGWTASAGAPADFSDIKLAKAAIPNRWQHILVTFDGTSKKIYIDNRETGNSEEFTISNSGSNSNLFVGQNAAGQNRLAGAAIDDLRIYNKILTSVERTAVFLAKNNYYLE